MIDPRILTELQQTNRLLARILAAVEAPAPQPLGLKGRLAAVGRLTGERA